MAKVLSRTAYQVVVSPSDIARNFQFFSEELRSRIMAEAFTDRDITLDVSSQAEAHSLASLLNGYDRLTVQVGSETSNNEYEVLVSDVRGPLSCTCPAFTYATTYCKHMQQVEKLRKSGVSPLPKRIDFYGNVITR